MFHFKQFSIEDSGATMKVGTDAVLLGVLAEPMATPQRILDVGTGCGILSLMMAQRFPNAIIDAIDIDEKTVEVAAENFANSKWSDRLHAYNSSIQNYTPINDEVYDLVISNPPYFSNSLKNNNARKTLARHDVRLPIESMLHHALRLMFPHATISLVMPSIETEKALNEAAFHGLTCIQRTDICNKPGDQAKLSIFNLSRNDARPMPTQKYAMRNSDNSFSTWYRDITRDFYLWSK